MSHHWEAFNNVKEMAENSTDPVIAEKVDLILSAAMESIADNLPTANVQQLREGAVAARNALEAYERLDQVDELSPSFAAGRIASAVDVLGYASYQTADETIVDLAKKQPYSRVLVALMGGPKRNVDLVSYLEKDKAQISKWLADLRASGAVTSHKHGRELVSAITPVGRLVVEAGWQDERRAPLQTSKIVDLNASRYDLSARSTPEGVVASDMPRISASGS